MSASARAEFLWKPSAAVDQFQLVEFRGEEALCADFEFDLLLRAVRGMTAADRDAAIGKLLGRPVAFGFDAAAGPRWFHGYVGEAAADGPREVSLTVVPWLWFLARDRGHRTYLNRSVPQVIEAALRDHPFADFRWEIAAGNFPAVERIVRFDESTAGFVTRLLAHAGIAWHWEHDAHGGRHTLVMNDGSVPPKSLSGEPIRYLTGRGRAVVRKHFGIRAWQPSRTVTASAVRLADYDPAAPRTPASGQSAGGAVAGPGPLEEFDSPAAVRTPKEAATLARARDERSRIESGTITGSGDATGLTAGRTFRTAAADGEFLVTSIRHTVVGSRSRPHYENEFECVPADLPYRPPTVEWLRIPGTFPGHVVGPDGSLNPGASPVHTDERGRVRVKFAWHRADEDSGWMRVAHPGGQMRIPRVGEEVYVVWEHGNPDRPVVIASSYPAADEALFEPAADPLPVVIRQPFPKGEKVNEIRFDSAAGQEQLLIHAGKDALFETKENFSEAVEKNRRSVVRGNDTSLVEGRTVELCKKSRVTRANGALAVSSGGAMLLKSKRKIVIDAPEIVLLGPGGSFIKVSALGVTIEGKPFTQINCGGSASGESEPQVEPEKLPPPPKQLPKPKQPLLLPKPRG